MIGHRIGTELFVIPLEQKYLVYAPFKRVVLLMNDAGIDTLKSLGAPSLGANPNKEFMAILKRAGILTKTEEPLRRGIPTETLIQFSPTSVTIMPTSDCNLRCVYCYSLGGESKTILNVEVAKAAIDYCAENAVRSKHGALSISFHGGGEPTIGWNILTKSVKYAMALAQNYDLKLHTTLVTNGVFGDKKCEWIGRNISSIIVSLDGPEDVQNNQRPLAMGGGTFHIVQRTLAGFDKDNVKYTVQSTVTKRSVNTMGQLVKLMHKHTGVIGIHFEPLVFCGRCLKTKWQSPDTEMFIQRFREAANIGEKLGIDIYYSGAAIRQPLSKRFCGVSKPNFIVTPAGYVTSCVEVTDAAHRSAETFIYGQYDNQRKKFVFDHAKIGQLRSLTVENRQYCNDCFLKWHCSGDCPARAMSSGKNYMQAAGTERCLINWELSKDQLLKLLNHKRLGVGDSVDIQYAWTIL
jgi:uncharacterized protein